jgi:acyl-[acyl-carrier-protein]-phospholipid O-acyltransferase/long-chain-fatty-acid--[acyl-carrier-protein] ligase
MAKTLEQYLLRPVLAFFLKLMFRVEVRGLENYHAAGDKVVIASNHQSFLDPLMLSVFIPEKPTFAMNLHQANKWYFCWIDWLLKTYKIDPLAPMSLKTLMTDVKKGAKIVIFPEGRITNSGGIMKIYEGTGRIIEKTGATLLPVHISGAKYSKFGKLGKKLRTRFFPKIIITFLPPKQYAEGEKISSLMMYDVLTNAAFAASDYRRPILAAILEAAEKHGNKHRVATDITRTQINYRQLFTRSFILREKLEKRLSEQNFVAVMLPNSLGALITFVTLQMLGKTPAMLNFSAGEKNILHACNLATVKTVLTSRVFIEKGKLEHIAASLEENYSVIYLEDIRPTVTTSDKLKALFKAIFAKENLKEIISKTDANSPAVVLYTSGSEGSPKGVALSHINLLSNINQASAVLDLNPSDMLFNAMPVFHSFGLTIGMLLPMMRGINMFLYPTPVHYRFIPEIVYDCSATVMLGTDTFFNGYARYAHQYDFNSIRLAVAGAEKLKESTIHLYAEKFCVNIMQGYGVTEASPVISFNTLIEHKAGSVGRAFPEIECRVEKIEGMERGGKLLIKGANIMLGYIKADDVGVVQPQGQWYDTGDIVEIDENGFITILGRAKRFAKIAGEMVSLMIPEDLALHMFPDCVHAALAVTDERKGEHIILCSECEGLTRENLISLAREKGMPEIALPKHILHIPEIPRLGSGKIDYPELARRINLS